MKRKLIYFLLLVLWTPAVVKADEETQQNPVVSPTVVPVFPTAAPTQVTAAPSMVYADHLSPIDHAGIWTKFDLSYNYAGQADLLNSAVPINNQTYVNPGELGTYTGSASSSHNGLGLGFELGFLLNTSSGIALGAHYLQTDEYNANVNYPNAGPDSESVTLLPTVIPITLDYYFFLPDSGGRFFLSVGAGFYAANVRVSQKTTSDNFLGSNNNGPDVWSGNLSSSALGFQAGVGREFAISSQFGITLFARGRYARISNFQGKLLDSNASSENFGLATGTNGVVDIDSTANITSANNEHYTMIDFTGFEAGVALNFYHF